MPLKNLYHFLHDLAYEVRTGEVQHRYTRLNVIAEDIRPRETHRVSITLESFGREYVNVDVHIGNEIYDRLLKWFKKESRSDGIEAEGEYHININNMFITRGYGRIESTWEKLGDDIYSLISKLQIEISKTTPVEIEAWKWFKKKVEESRDWWELTRLE